MKKKGKLTLRSAQVKQIMGDYFKIAGPLLVCRSSAESQALSDRLLALVLDIYAHQELMPLCTQILRETDTMHNTSDSQLLRTGKLPVSEELLYYFETRAACLRQLDMQLPASFDMDLLLETVRKAGAGGVVWAIRLGACLNWLEVDGWSTGANALRLWKLLAFAGDEFAMRAMAHSLKTMGEPQKAQVWQQVHSLCERAGSQLLVALPPEMLAQVSKEAGDMATLIVSLRGVLWESKDRLPLAMLQYAAEGRDSLQQKLRNLCVGQNVFQLKLLQEQLDGQKPYGLY